MTKPNEQQTGVPPSVDQAPPPEATELSQDDLAKANGAGFIEDLIHAIENR